MNAIINAAFSRGRTVVMVLAMILVMGASAYLSIAKESEPDVAIPIMFVAMTHSGISPQDAERLLINPMEKELQQIKGLKEMRSTAAEGYATVVLEFDAGFDADQALQDVREKVDIAKVQLPPETDEPRVSEINIALFPVLTVVLSGNAPERTLLSTARDLKDKIEAVGGVLEVDIGGDRAEVLEVIIDPSVMQTYDISYNDLANLVRRNNRLVAAGALDTGAGRLVLKVPGVIEDLDDVLNLPVKVSGNTVVTFQDVATVRRTFEDAEGFARVGGDPALVLEISKRTGANIIDTIESVRAIVERESAGWAQGIAVSYLLDKSEQIRDFLGDLENNVITAIVLVMIVVIAALGLRPAVLVGLAIPGSFLAGILVLYGMGLTMNMIVLFSLILVVGMLVDGAIVTIELADRNMADGVARKQAYAKAANRMAWPIIASTATTLAVFFPLLFWPGVVGEFMKFLPITVIVTLSASLLMALIFIPVLGGMIGGSNSSAGEAQDARKASAGGDPEKVGGLSGVYLRSLGLLLDHPGKTLLVAVGLLVGTYAAYWTLGRGVEFFPNVEPEFAQVQVQARGDLSVQERDSLVRRVEQRLLGQPELTTVYARTFGATAQLQTSYPEDVIGIIQLEFADWRERRPAAEILPELRQKTADIAGIRIQVRKQESGPSDGKPVQIELSGQNQNLLAETVGTIRQLMASTGGFIDIEDSRPLPSIEWRLNFDREEAARYGADVTLLGDAVQMVTSGVKLAEYRPDDADEELDIRLRFPFNERNLDQLKALRVPTTRGQVPIGNFIALEPAQKTGTISRTDGRRVMTIKADVPPGVLVDAQVNRLRAALSDLKLNPAVTVTFKGQDQDQRESAGFLVTAFVIAIFLMIAILVTQFNSFYQAGLVLSAIVLSTAGVLLGLLVTGQPFGVVMGGIGVIALAGIVVNNNIVLIDTYNDLRAQGQAAREAILRTAAQRLRPVLLTSITTVLGLLPMVLSMTLDIAGRDLMIGAPSSQWWEQLSSVVAGGLTFATVLTLALTPALLMLGENMSGWWRRWRHS